MTKDEALKLALEALKWSKPQANAEITYNDAITAIKEALAQPEQEPVAWANRVVGGRKWLSIHASKGASDRWLEYRLKEQAQGEQYKQVALYITPLQRTWVGLTDEEKDKLANAWFLKDGDTDVAHRKAIALIEEVEAAHGIKGEA